MVQILLILQSFFGSLSSGKGECVEESIDGDKNEAVIFRLLLKQSEGWGSIEIENWVSRFPPTP